MESTELEISTEEEYDEEFVKELLESSNGPSVTIDIEDLWKSEPKSKDLSFGGWAFMSKSAEEIVDEIRSTRYFRNRDYTL